jgi:phospholipid-translocating ATPase
MEGLRTLVITHKLLSDAQYQDFEKRLKKARGEFVDREAKVQAAIESLESDMDFLAVTGVEDKLQENVLETIETLR